VAAAAAQEAEAEEEMMRGDPSPTGRRRAPQLRGQPPLGGLAMVASHQEQDFLERQACSQACLAGAQMPWEAAARPRIARRRKRRRSESPREEAEALSLPHHPRVTAKLVTGVRWFGSKAGSQGWPRDGLQWGRQGRGRCSLGRRREHLGHRQEVQAGQEARREDQKETPLHPYRSTTPLGRR